MRVIQHAAEGMGIRGSTLGWGLWLLPLNSEVR